MHLICKYLVWMQIPYTCISLKDLVHVIWMHHTECTICIAYECFPLNIQSTSHIYASHQTSSLQPIWMNRIWMHPIWMLYLRHIQSIPYACHHWNCHGIPCECISNQCISYECNSCECFPHRNIHCISYESHRIWMQIPCERISPHECTSINMFTGFYQIAFFPLLM